MVKSLAKKAVAFNKKLTTLKTCRGLICLPYTLAKSTVCLEIVMQSKMKRIRKNNNKYPQRGRGQRYPAALCVTFDIVVTCE